jgi:hypothetical protein
MGMIKQRLAAGQQLSSSGVLSADAAQ